MFAPRSGRYLLLSALGLSTLSVGLAARWIDPSLLADTLLAVGWGFWAFFVVFFRDPERSVGEGIVAPADGRIRAVETEGGRLRISTFMNVTDVHVNRFPLEATVARMETRGSGFRAAFTAEARHNLRQHYELSTGVGDVEVVQMTGLVARRLVPLVRPGEHRPKGARLGMILLGSRVDLLLPADRVSASVRVGERVKAGESTVARERS